VPLTSEPPDLLQITAASNPAYPHRGPAELGHQLRKSPVVPGTSGALRDFENIQHPLSSNALYTIVTNLATQSSERQTPGVAVTGASAHLRPLQAFEERHDGPPEA